MSLTEFKVALEASRNFEHDAGGAKFKLRRPTDHAWRNALERYRKDGRLLESEAMREVLDTALVGWEGVTQAFLLEGGGDEVIAFSAEARALLLEFRQDIADALSFELASRIGARIQQFGAEAKKLIARVEYELNGETGGTQFGFTREQWLAGRPALTPFNRQVVDVWRWCDGWNPALIMGAAAYHGVEDVELLVDLLLAMRGVIDAHAERKRRAA